MKQFFKLTLLMILILSVSLLSGCNKFNTEIYSANGFDVDLYQIEDQDEMYNKFSIFQKHAGDYYGKSIRLEGYYDVTYATVNDEPNVYHFVIIPDSDGCSYLYVEFNWMGHKLTEYPEIGTKVVITGLLDQYSEGDTIYDYIRCDSLEILEEENITDEENDIRNQIIEKENSK